MPPPFSFPGFGVPTGAMYEPPRNKWNWSRLGPTLVFVQIGLLGAVISVALGHFAGTELGLLMGTGFFLGQGITTLADRSE